jgi:hypothetical protein
MDSHDTGLFLAHFQESHQNILTGRGAVDKKEVVVRIARLKKSRAFIHLVVQSHYSRHTIAFPDGKVILGSHLRQAAKAFLGPVRPSEGDELVGDHDVEVSILHALEVFVLLRVEGLEVEQLEFVGFKDTLKTVQHRQRVSAQPHGRVAKRQERLHTSQTSVGLGRCLVHVKNLETAHEGGRISSALRLGAAEIDNPLVLVSLKFGPELVAEAIKTGEIEWSEIREEGLIAEGAVCRKAVPSGSVSRRAVAAYKVEAALNDFHSPGTVELILGACDSH